MGQSAEQSKNIRSGMDVMMEKKCKGIEGGTMWSKSVAESIEGQK